MSNQKIKILIVEDELLIAQDIANRLTSINYQIVGIAISAERALQLITENNDIDIILIDIILKGELDGIELAGIINNKHHIPFIFLTSHADTHLVGRAKKVKPYAYMLKPFNDRQISIAIELALVNYSNKTPERDLINDRTFNTVDNQVLHIKDSLFLKKDHHFERVPLKEILFLQADSNYCTVCTKSERFIYSTVLKKIEAQLPIDQFLRVHRSYVININSVNGFEGNMLFIGKKKIPVSKTYKDAVFKLFRTI
ncbi:LytR/AlgR family response regulator transcription factor [Flavivirga spongiicola]|uniref:LytTR family transcriptional regulator DNA-binding domain-containing protein n=1 Tax=Flavivirga spongiicola TaxID=421621 RepID=A0ABU7XSE8_9FLAO|nr:LytTR family transcriptional regulator DNA-binding domain-containing protein [Flavivirga sp. MEBiC05379]MDO5978363.1 LytTR family transcriptional regulator DNA-binding domain-containing protein [Flavivirga sp. MEBiC05379]